MRLAEKVNVEIGFDGSFEFAAHFFAIREMQLVVNGVKKAEKKITRAEHKHRPFGFQTNETVVSEPGGEVVVPGFVAMLTAAEGFEAQEGHSKPFRLFGKDSGPFFGWNNDSTIDGLGLEKGADKIELKDAAFLARH